MLAMEADGGAELDLRLVEETELLVGHAEHVVELGLDQGLRLQAGLELAHRIVQERTDGDLLTPLSRPWSREHPVQEVVDRLRLGRLAFGALPGRDRRVSLLRVLARQLREDRRKDR